MFPVVDIIEHVPTIKVVDVGAMWLGQGVAPYWPLLDLGLATIIGFEPVEDECRKLNSMFPFPHRHFPLAIGDGSERRLHVCNAPMTSSIYEPNTALVSRFNELPDIMQVIREVPVTTTRLDDIPEVSDSDFIKIDVQGAELDVLAGAARVLQRALVVHTEVEFVPLYRGQPLFAEVDSALRNAGYCLFALDSIQTRAYRPLSEDDAVLLKTRQALWTDAVYVKSLFDLEQLDYERLLRLFVILHFVYGAFDLCQNVLTYLDSFAGSDAADRYGAKVASWVGASRQGC